MSIETFCVMAVHHITKIKLHSYSRRLLPWLISCIFIHWWSEVFFNTLVKPGSAWFNWLWARERQHSVRKCGGLWISRSRSFVSACRHSGPRQGDARRKICQQPTLRPLTRLTAGRDVVGYPPTVIRASHASHKAVRISHSRLVPPRFPEGGRTGDKQRDVWLIFPTAAVGVAAAVSGAGPPAVSAPKDASMAVAFHQT